MLHEGSLELSYGKCRPFKTRKNMHEQELARARINKKVENLEQMMSDKRVHKKNMNERRMHRVIAEIGADGFDQADICRRMLISLTQSGMDYTCFTTEDLKGFFQRLWALHLKERNIWLMKCRPQDVS